MQPRIASMSRASAANSGGPDPDRRVERAPRTCRTSSASWSIGRVTQRRMSQPAAPRRRSRRSRCRRRARSAAIRRRRGAVARGSSAWTWRVSVAWAARTLSNSALPGLGDQLAAPAGRRSAAISGSAACSRHALIAMVTRWSCAQAGRVQCGRSWGTRRRAEARPFSYGWRNAGLPLPSTKPRSPVSWSAYAVDSCATRSTATENSAFPLLRIVPFAQRQDHEPAEGQHCSDDGDEEQQEPPPEQHRSTVVVTSRKSSRGWFIGRAARAQ